jgi:hypothetical protein
MIVDIAPTQRVEIENGIAHKLSGSVVGDIPSPPDLEDLDSDLSQLVST